MFLKQNTHTKKPNKLKEIIIKKSNRKKKRGKKGRKQGKLSHYIIFNLF